MFGQVPGAVGAARSAYGQSRGDLTTASNYYRNILGGGRGAMNAALAPERSSALDYYGGAEQRIARTVRGPQRDTQLAELERQKVGNLASMAGVARRGAATGLADVGSRIGQFGDAEASLASLYGNMGTALTGQGTNAQANALYGSQALFNQGAQVGEQQRQTGSDVGKFIFDIVSSMPGGKGKSKSTLSNPSWQLYKGPTATPFRP